MSEDIAVITMAVANTLIAVLWVLDKIDWKEGGGEDETD